MDDTPQTAPLPAGLRLLKTLVILLLVTMIAAVITITWVLVTRMPDGTAIPLPESLTLPQGANAASFTLGPDYMVITTTDGRILIYGRDGSFKKDLPLR